MVDIFELNKQTQNDILKYKSFDIYYIIKQLLNENKYEDAKLLCFHVNNMSSKQLEFIKWLISQNKLKMDEEDIIFLCENALKQELSLIKNFMNIQFMLPYCIKSNHIKFVKWVFQFFNIKKIHKECILKCNNIYILHFLNKYINLQHDDSIIIQYLKKLCKSGNFKCFLFIEKKYNYEKTIYLEEFFKLSFIHNNYEILKYLIQIYNHVIAYIKKYYMKSIKNMSYKCIEYIHSIIISKNLFKISEYNDILINIISTRKKIPYSFFQWYKKKFCNIDSKHYEILIKNLFQYDHIHILYSFKKYIKYKNLNMYFIKCCYNGNLNSIKFLYKNIKKNIVNEGFRITCFKNHYSCVKWFYDKIPQKDIYNNLFKLVHKVNTNINIEIIKLLYSKVHPVFPLKLPLYLCIKNNFIWWIQENENYFMKYFQYYLNIICYYGYYDTLIYIKKYLKDEHVKGAFISSCEDSSGFFISKWLYHNYNIDIKVIEQALLYSNNLETIKWLYQPCINLRKNNNAYFIYHCINSNVEIVEWLTTIYQNYSYISLDNKIVDFHIDLYILYKENIDISIKDDELCSICLTNKMDSITSCNHFFCYDCIHKWYSKNNTCPLCRQILHEIIQPLPLLPNS